MKKKSAGKSIFHIVNDIVLALALICAGYIMAHGLGLIDSLDFGAGAYFYADIPEFSKYTDPVWYQSPIPMWVLIILFLVWGSLMYKLWCWMERKEK